MPDSDRDLREHNNACRSGGRLLFAMLLLSPVFYILSIGPVVWLIDTGYLPMSVSQWLYLPVNWLHQHTPLQDPLEWYVELWR